MKYLILCEGNNEVCLINLLLKHNKLKIKYDDLVALKPFNARQLTNPTIKSELRVYNKSVIVLWVGDTQHDKLSIPNDLNDIVSKERIFKYCTLPELEILLIINEGMYKQYLKSKETPKSFAKRNLVYNGKRYDQSNNFLEEYYGGKRINLLVKNIQEYKKIKKHKKDELYLSDLLRWYKEIPY